MNEWSRNETKEEYKGVMERGQKGKNEKKQHAFEEGKDLRSCFH